MDHLHTPWRRGYVSQLKEKRECVLCAIQSDPDDDANILLRGVDWYVVVNKFPYTSGHLMVVSRAHLGGFGDLTDAAAAEYPGLLAHCEAALTAEYHPAGLNVGLNMGRFSGAGVEGHLHWHLVPRFPGDANFLTTVGDTRVLPETVDESYRRLQPYFQEG